MGEKKIGGKKIRSHLLSHSFPLFFPNFLTTVFFPQLPFRPPTLACPTSQPGSIAQRYTEPAMMP